MAPFYKHNKICMATYEQVVIFLNLNHYVKGTIFLTILNIVTNIFQLIMNRYFHYLLVAFNLSQPALSRFCQLEEEIGVPLFDTEGSGVEKFVRFKTFVEMTMHYLKYK